MDRLFDLVIPFVHSRAYLAEQMSLKIYQLDPRLPHGLISLM